MIYCETHGQGPDLVLLHGWGMHSGLWQPVVEHLSPHWRITTVDLPGHGRSPLPPGGFDLTRMAALMLDAAPPPARWVGWSLGGLVATRAALLQPHAVTALCLINTLPKFVRGPDWPHAMSPDTLDSFAANLEQDYALTLQRFLSLQVRGAQNERHTLRLIRKLVAARPAAQPEALRLGLALLRQTDLRPELKHLRCPIHYILGERDTLAPAAAAPALQALLPRATVTPLPGAGHAPFLSHKDAFFAILNDCLQHTA